MTSDWRPTASLQALRLRARLYAMARAFFDARGVLEVETPILSQAGNTDPNIESFVAHFDGHVSAGSRQRWMRTSPEFPLKRLLAAGIGDCYELGRVFRNGEAGRRHNPEFTMLEWYRVGWDHRRLMREAVDFVLAALALAGRGATVRETTYRDLFLAATGLDPMLADEHALRVPLEGIVIDTAGLRRDDWLDLLFTHRIQPDFAVDEIVVVHDFPASQCALARIRKDDPPVAERFELFLGPSELANGYHELADVAEQRARFANDATVRASRGTASPAQDERLLDALASGFPDCAGVALGIDRLLACLLGSDELAATLAFPFDRA